ncbi:MAG: N-formylglutamate amidohydrolase [Bdellovibrionales bacterium]|nr:N-formylglutamate amidohydrolase [Bdellovibrionales bacterium]
MDENLLEKIKRLPWGDIKKHIAAKTPFEAISPMGSMLIRINKYEPLVALMPHTGHRVREEIISKMSIEEEDRLKDEDVHLHSIVKDFPVQIFGLDSRYEYDVDRSRSDAIYLKPFQCWGKKVWVNPPSKDEIELSLQKYDEFQELMEYLTEEFMKMHSKLVFLDLHGIAPKAGTKITGPFQMDIDTAFVTQEKANKSLDAFTASLKNIAPTLSVRGGTKVAGSLAKHLSDNPKALVISLGIGRPEQPQNIPSTLSQGLLKSAISSLEIL